MKHLVSLLVVLGISNLLLAQPNFETPKAVTIDAKVAQEIAEKLKTLTQAIASFPANVPPAIRDDVAIYQKAGEWMTRHGEYVAKDTAKQTLSVLEAGLSRAKAARQGEAPWLKIRGKPFIRAYRSKVDGSLQPYSLYLPEGEQPKNPRIDVVLHGRDQTLTEVKFLYARETAKPGTRIDHIVVEVYGRGNNAYRWAGEQDIWEALAAVQADYGADGPVILRGFSMGGAGTWHLGLHHPGFFRAISPGAGFTTTYGYIKNLAKLPEYQDRCLHIYDAADYAENAFNVPVVAYSGSIDPQKAAADNIESALAKFPEKVPFQHLVAPGLAHKQPPEWLAKIEAEFQKHLQSSLDRKRIHFVTYTLRYPTCDWVTIEGLARHYDRAVVDAAITDSGLSLSTQNVTHLKLQRLEERKPFAKNLQIDGQALTLSREVQAESTLHLVKTSGQWSFTTPALDTLRKRPGLQGPIDDVFHTPFRVVGPGSQGFADTTAQHLAAAYKRFGYEWDKYFRGTLPTESSRDRSVILFGDPASNPEIRAILPKLPIQWTAEKLVVNGVQYDAKTHLPVMIYPHPEVPGKYVVLNTGHTFHAADLKGTNALLYPRLGDWAVIKPAPTKADPAAVEVVTAGIFDENWQFAPSLK